jgi:hypothetical protein
MFGCKMTRIMPLGKPLGKPQAGRSTWTEGCTVLICPHCGKEVSGRVLIVYLPHSGPAFSGPSSWHGLECGKEWPREVGGSKREG